MGHVSAVTGFAFTRLPLKEGFCILAFGSHNKSYWVLSELCQNKFPLKVSKQSMESFCYTLLDSSNKRQYYLSLGEEASSMCTYSKNMLLTQPRKENVGPTVNPVWFLGCCFFLHALKLTVAQRSSTTCATAPHMMWLTCCRALGHSKIPAVRNLKTELAFSEGSNLTQICGDAHQEHPYLLLITHLITYILKHAIFSALLFPFNWHLSQNLTSHKQRRTHFRLQE